MAVQIYFSKTQTDVDRQAFEHAVKQTGRNPEWRETGLALGRGGVVLSWKDGEYVPMKPGTGQIITSAHKIKCANDIKVNAERIAYNSMFGIFTVIKNNGDTVYYNRWGRKMLLLNMLATGIEKAYERQDPENYGSAPRKKEFCR